MWPNGRMAEWPNAKAYDLRTVPGSSDSRGMVCRDPPEHDAHGEADEGGSFASMTFEVLGESTAVADPSEGPFDGPALGQTTKRCRSERLTMCSRHAPVLATILAIFGPW